MAERLVVAPGESAGHTSSVWPAVFRTMQATSELRDAIWRQGELLNELTFHARLLNARPGDFDVVTLMLASVVEVNEQYERITRLISSQSN